MRRSVDMHSRAIKWNMSSYNVNYNRLGIMNVTYSDLLGTVSLPWLDPKTKILEPGMILYFHTRETLSFQSPGQILVTSHSALWMSSTHVVTTSSSSGYCHGTWCSVEARENPGVTPSLQYPSVRVLRPTRRWGNPCSCTWG